MYKPGGCSFDGGAHDRRLEAQQIVRYYDVAG